MSDATTHLLLPYSLVNDADPSKKAVFSLSGISTGTTRSWRAPCMSTHPTPRASFHCWRGRALLTGGSVRRISG